MISVLAQRYARAYLRTHELSEALLICIMKVSNALKKQKNAKAYLGMMERFGLDPRPVLQTFFKQYGCDSENFDTLFDLLYEQKRFLLLQDILDAIVKQFKKNEGLITCMVTSAASLSSQEKKVVERFIHKHMAPKAYIEYYNDPSLIAGIRISTDNLLWENTIAQQLRNLAFTVEGITWK